MTEAANGNWYMVNRDGMATLCTNRADAEKEAADAQSVWPHMGPHRAVRLVEASFEAADIATTAADGFRAGYESSFSAADMAAAKADGFSDGAAEVAKLRGQRMVLCSLLGECRGHLADAADAMYSVVDEIPVWDLVRRIESALKAISEDQVKGGES